MHTDDLSDALAGSGAMAGDSSFAGDFAAAYDEAAAATLAACDDVVGGLASLCRITACSYDNHLRAERSSITNTETFTAEPRAQAHLIYGAASPTPPSSLGGDASLLPGWANVILDHVEGFVWPDADVDRLRSTAAAWRAAAAGLEVVSDKTGGAITSLFEERSPEVLPATNAIGNLRLCTADVAAACTQLATACDDYATQVETQRELILDLVRDLIRDAVLIAAAGFVLGLVTGGSTNAVAAWINSGKLAAKVPQFKAFVETLRLWGAGAATGLRSGTEAVVQVRNRLTPFRNIAPIRAWSHSAVTDAGAVARVRALLGDPTRLDPQLLRGMSRRDIRELLSHWEMKPASKGVGLVFVDPVIRGRQIRVMEAYRWGSRENKLTLGDYVVVSQNGSKFKVPLEGNPLL
ncbi:hypothetical protein [Nocardioides rubriscoriae]|uniref:WXG100-like domain-containing protein n=1 Tax=Nocardioides rubriscoriae TaxID=642762 RepID=UPI0011DF23C3|nr:hypothetical protein [Nocardioides rubriscoriae]